VKEEQVRRKSLFAAIVVAVLLAAATVALTARGGFGQTAAAADAGAPAAAAGTAGCGKAPALASGTHTIQSSSQTRSYILQVPSNYDSSHPYRLIFAFHWVGGTASDVDSGGSSGFVWSYYGLRALANNSTIFVAPQGINNGWANSGGQDVTFVDNMLSQFEAGLCIDTSEVFSMGFSYGGAMTYALACARPSVFRAVAVYSGANLSGCSGGSQPAAYIGLHGVEDTTLPIADGRALRDTFVRNNGCTPQNPPEPAAGSLTHIVTTYSGCRSGYPVVWAAFDSGHTPAPVDGSTATSGTGAQTWTKALVWNFFSQFQSTTTGPTPTPTTPTPTQTRAGPITAGGNSAKCVDDNGLSSADGTKIQMWDCNGGANQQWTVASDGTLQVLGKCLDITGANFGNGTLIELWTCNGGANQQWRASNGALVNPASGKCLDDPGSNTANGTQLDLWTCTGGTNQQWHLPS
jgi:poly(3-hydroxybutyrate) depolymerase